ncbi:mRNA-decapping enzyme 1B [Nilaparvata lugens]|uniref:mRNA-decapping enzyme 1B n=1 Tax=Nilaparvata lugens TaxID=108931 RepID=UPI00193D1FB8|nr:mRNA-decapping enzyme 1B [Nilaparvata lugens]
MAEQSAEARMNTAALKRADPYLKELLETAAHVALYTFNPDVNEWEKTEVEGALFVYSRTGEPFHNILIMNRLNCKNFVEPVIRGLDLHLEDPYLLYRTPKGSIYCVWFYDKRECSRIGQALDRLVKETTLNSSSTAVDKTQTKKGEGIDIFSMLSKAQEEYNSASSKDGNGNKPEDNTPKSVKDFFMKASSSTAWSSAQQNPPEVVPAPRGAAAPLAPPPGLTQIPAQEPPVFPSLEKLLLDPQNSLQHIENKLQKTTSPQPIQNGGGLVSPTSNVVQTLNFFNSNLTKSYLKMAEDGKLVMPQPAMFPNQPAMFPSNSLMTSQVQTPSEMQPLTKTQLLQALEYLMNNDDEFIPMLHAAYVKSLTRKTS